MLSFIQKIAATGKLAHHVRRDGTSFRGEASSDQSSDSAASHSSAGSKPRASSRSQNSDPARKKLFLLATALVTRGHGAEEAYKRAVYYVYGPGRSHTWMRALIEEDQSAQQLIELEFEQRTGTAFQNQRALSAHL